MIRLVRIRNKKLSGHGRGQKEGRKKTKINTGKKIEDTTGVRNES